MSPGPIALVGSGEYLPVMLEVERGLLAGRPPRYVQLPTAAGEEGPDSLARWVALGAEQAQRLGVEAVAVLAVDRPSAELEANARLIEGAGLLYLSGGRPAYVADTLRGTRVWTAIVDTWHRGAALAGCSAGAMALGASVPDIRNRDARPREGLGIVPLLRVLPHFDRFRVRAPEWAETAAAKTPPGQTLIGIDEETAIVADGTDLHRWEVQGRQSAWVYHPGKPEPVPYAAGEQIVL
jgi:cyanophycinase-like exopeptidase